MDKSSSEQGWQQLQANIARFLERSLQGDGRGLVYEPRFIGLLERTSVDAENRAAGER